MILQRNVHKSVIHGLMLAGVQAVFLEPLLDTDSGLAVAPAAETVQAALAAYPEAAAVLVTMPNYYGMGSDLAPSLRSVTTAVFRCWLTRRMGRTTDSTPSCRPGR